MKTLMIANVMVSCWATALFAAEPKATPPAPDPLVVQYDLNGKIDVDEAIQERKDAIKVAEAKAAQTGGKP